MKSTYYKKQIKKYNIEDNKDHKTLFIIGAIHENYPNKNNPYLQFKFQKEAYEYLKVTNTKTIIKLPQIFEKIKYPILDCLDENYYKISFSQLKIFKALNLYKPNVIILDRFSTTLYECLFYDIEIIMFLDKKETPYPDVLNILKKRVHVVYNINQFKIVYKMILRRELSKLDKSFFKKILFKKKQNNNIQDFINKF